MSYTVTLEDFPDITERGLHDAVQRFRRTLERTLGGADAVIPTLRAWQTAQEADPDELSADDIALAQRWMTAASRARNEGFRDLGDDGEAYFDVRIER